jgi:hypothetical protein
MTVRCETDDKDYLLEPLGMGSHRNLQLVHQLCQTWGIRTNESGQLLWAVVASPPDRGPAAVAPVGARCTGAT